jgi:peptide/nickel transport system substrate-binding protein
MNELGQRLAAADISLEEFLWAAKSAGIDRVEAAQIAVSAAATSTPGSRSVAGPTGSRPSSDLLRVGLFLPVDGMDPAINTYRTSRLVTEQLYSTLMALGPDGRPYPDLAAWVDVSDDALTYTFGLVDGVRFHDGSPVTADDVAATFRRLLDMGEAYHFDPWVETIGSVDAADPLTVRIRLTQTTGPILTWLAFCGTGIVPRSAIEAGRDLEHDPIGSGPFRLDAAPWAGGDAPIRLVRHDASVRGGHAFVSRLPGIEFRAIPSAEERARALLDGAIDLDSLLDPAALATVGATPGLLAHQVPDSRWHWLVVNCRQAPLGDVRVRRAIAHALDRRALLGAFHGLGMELTAGVVAPWSFAAAPELNGFGPTADVGRARTLLAEAGVGPGTRLTIDAASTLPIAIRQAELIAGQLQAVGLDAAVDIVPPDVSAKRVSRDGDFQLATSYWGSPIWDPDDFVWMGFRSGARYDSGSCSNPALDAAMDEGRGTVVQATRRAAYQRLQRLAVDDLPVIPTIQPALLRGTTSALAGYVPTPNAQLRTLRDTWLSREAS